MLSLMMAVTVWGAMVARQVIWCTPWLNRISMPNAW